MSPTSGFLNLTEAIFCFQYVCMYEHKAQSKHFTFIVEFSGYYAMLSTMSVELGRGELQDISLHSFVKSMKTQNLPNFQKDNYQSIIVCKDLSSLLCGMTT